MPLAVGQRAIPASRLIVAAHGTSPSRLEGARGSVTSRVRGGKWRYAAAGGGFAAAGKVRDDAVTAFQSGRRQMQTPVPDQVLEQAARMGDDAARLELGNRLLSGHRYGTSEHERGLELLLAAASGPLG